MRFARAMAAGCSQNLETQWGTGYALTAFNLKSDVESIPGKSARS